MKRNLLTVAFVFLCVLFAGAQNWVVDMHNPYVNFFTVQQEFNAWWATNGQRIQSETANGESEQGELWKLYKRWEHDMLPRMIVSNGVRLGQFDEGERSFYRQRAQHVERTGASWSYIGPSMSFDDGGGDSVAGRVNCVRFDPLNRNTIYCGAPSGGLWKTVDFGANWQLLNTDNLPQIGVSDIAINPQNPNTIYIATGDIANSACLSIGVLKSIDGGLTWDTTGLTYTTSQGRLIARLLMSPLDSNTMYAATNTGVFKTIDGGLTWREIDTIAGLTGMEFNPANCNTIYAWGTQLYKSVDAGATWKKLSAGLPVAAQSGGFGVGLTPADTACIYVLASGTPVTGQADLPYKGVYRSTNAGDTFVLRCATPDGQGTQGTYDLAVGVSPVNRDMVIIGTVNCNFSVDGGVNWNGPSVASHVDHHDIRFFNGSRDTVFSANDGGLFISVDSGNTWRGLNNGMHIGQIYNISSGGHTKDLYLSGRQDEGTLFQDTTTQRLLSNGDGLECWVDPLNENHMIGSIENGIIGTSYNGGMGGITVLCYDYGTGVNGPGVWNTPFVVQSGASNIIYVGKDFIYKSTNSGNNWTALHSPTLLGSDNLYVFLAVAPGNPNYIYAATLHKLYRSTDGGNTFSNITAGFNGTFTSLAVSPANPKEVWVGFNAAHSGELLKSVNAGTSFTIFDTGLPTVGPFYPISIAPVRDSKDALYCSLANAGGVYYRDSTMNSWMPYSNGLPNVSVDELEVDYCANKLRAATYGRDIWETDPYQALNTTPLASATYAIDEAHCSDTIVFTDRSDFYPTAWQWNFPGGQPASSNAQNPSVIYPDANTYTATLIASNAYGADTVNYSIETSFCTGVNQLTAGNIISVYPNPNNGNFTLSVTGQARGKINMVLINDVGQSVYKYAYTKYADVMTTSCLLPTLAKGIYYLTITTDGTSTVEKLVIEP